MKTYFIYEERVLDIIDLPIQSLDLNFIPYCKRYEKFIIDHLNMGNAADLVYTTWSQDEDYVKSRYLKT